MGFIYSILWRCQDEHNVNVISISKQLNGTNSLVCALFFPFQAFIRILFTDMRKQAVDLRVLKGKTNLVFTM